MKSTVVQYRTRRTEHQHPQQQTNQSEPEPTMHEASLQPISGLEKPSTGLILRDAPLNAVHPSNERFINDHLNKPCKAPRPKYGFPPRSFKPSHPQCEILRRLRAQTEVYPRWPDYPKLHVQKLRSLVPAYSSIVISDLKNSFTFSIIYILPTLTYYLQSRSNSQKQDVSTQSK